MLGFIFEYNGVKINDPSTFKLSAENKAYISVNGVSGFSGDSLQHTEASPVDTHGIIDYPSFMKGRLITITGGVVGIDEEECVKKCREISRAFSIPTSPQTRKDGYRKFTFYDHKNPDLKFFCEAKPHKLVEFTKKMGIGRLRLFEIQLRMENPFVYLADETLVELNAENSKREQVVKDTLQKSIGPRFVVNIENSSDIDVYIRYKVSGTFSRMVVKNKTTGLYQEIENLACEKTDFVEVNGKEGTAVKNEQNVVNQFTVDSDWITVLPGENELEFAFGTLLSPTGDIKIPTIEIGYNDIYLSVI